MVTAVVAGNGKAVPAAPFAIVMSRPVPREATVVWLTSYHGDEIGALKSQDTLCQVLPHNSKIDAHEVNSSIDSSQPQEKF